MNTDVRDALSEALDACRMARDLVHHRRLAAMNADAATSHTNDLDDAYAAINDVSEAILKAMEVVCR